MIGGAQLPLDLGHRPALGRDDFLIAPSNSLAVDWVDRWPHWPGGVLALYGSPGVGKTHLAEVWLALSRAHRIPVQALPEVDPVCLVDDVKTLLLEDADTLFGQAAETERFLLHLINAVRAEGGSLLVTSGSAPARWPVSLPDLRSRLATFQSAEIGAPDDSLLETLLVKLFHDRQLAVPREVVLFLLRRMERSCDAARRIVARIDSASLAERRDVTIPLVKRLLEVGEDGDSSIIKPGE